MAAFFTIGERKIRPGVYFRYENIGTPPVAGADDGRCAAVFRSNWGPLGRAVLLESFTDINRIYGDGGPNGTTDVPLEQFRGGARSVFAIRLGAGGTAGTYAIQDTNELSVITLTMLYPGSRKFSLTIRPTLENPNVSELLLLEGTARLERFTFSTPVSPPAGHNQVQALLDALNARKSAYFRLTLAAPSPNAIAVIDQVPIIAGTDPVAPIVGHYTDALDALEAFRWNVLAIDTNDTAVKMVTQMFLNRAYSGGKFVMGVIGETKAVNFETRLTQASSFNDYQIVFVGNGYTDMLGNEREGYLAAARVSGMIAGTPSSGSITHLSVIGAMDLTEAFTNNQYERAINAGMLTFSKSAANTVWVEQGINSLSNPGVNDDAGWKKIKRVKVRFELMQRITDTVELLVGRVNNDNDGRMNVVQASNNVCNVMVAEKKLLPGAHCVVDPDIAPEGDSAWFAVYADDIDSLEKLYFVFKFRFAAIAA